MEEAECNQRGESKIFDCFRLFITLHASLKNDIIVL